MFDESDPDRPGLPVFSVIIPAFNAARTITSAVRSALAQTRSDLEVIVVDDGSTDGTADAVASINDPRVRLISTPHRGVAAARNAAVDSARGTLVAFLDSDDLWLPSYLERVGSIETAGDCGFVYTDAYAFDPVSGRVRRRTAMERMRPPVPPPADAGTFLLELLKRNFVYTSTIVRRAVLAQMGGFNEARTAAVDYDLWLRIAVAGFRPAWIPGQQGLYRVHPGQLSWDVERMNRNLAAVYAELRMEDMPSAAHRELLAARRRQSGREVGMHEGKARWRATVLQARHHLGRARQQVGLGDRWYEVPPPEVTAAFPDLTQV